MASGSALVTDSEYHSASDSAQAPASELDSDLVQVSEPASDFPPAPDSVTDSVPDSATYSAPQPDYLPPFPSPQASSDAGSAPCCHATE